MARRRSSVLLLILLAGAACSREAPRAESPDEAEIAVPVAAQPARRGSIRAIIRTTGVVIPAAGSEFIATAPEPARIVEIPPAEGDRVARGDLLVRFDVPSAAAEAARHQADIARAEALLENARIAQARARELVEKGIISRREMENADRDVADAHADVARAEAARRASDTAAARAIIRAPFAGVIAQRLHDPGDVVQGIATDPILRLVDPDRLEVTAPIPAADASRVLPGAAARVTSVPEPIRLVVATRAVAGSGGADPVVRLTFAAAFAAPKAGPVDAARGRPLDVARGRPVLPVDTRVDIEIEGEEHIGAVLVPADAVVRTGNQAAVLVAAGDRAERRMVTTGLSDADFVEIVSGVEPGELVITRGQAGLADGAVISVDQPRP
jgi:multidrug efflux pump subunit AcrA (membrane-fusion protein)